MKDIQRLVSTSVEEIVNKAGKKPARYGLSSNPKAMHDFMRILGKRSDVSDVSVGTDYVYAFNVDGTLLAFVRDSDVYFFPTNDAAFNRSIAKQLDAAQRQL